MPNSDLPDDLAQEPTRDATLGHWLRTIDGARRIDESDLFRQRVTTAAAASLRRQQSWRWWQLTGQAGRFAIPVGLAAAAAALFTLRQLPARSVQNDPHLLAAVGAASSTEAAYWSVQGRDRALYSVFGEGGR
jgi:hypothetical protein